MNNLRFFRKMVGPTNTVPLDEATATPVELLESQLHESEEVLSGLVRGVVGNWVGFLNSVKYAAGVVAKAVWGNKAATVGIITLIVTLVAAFRKGKI